MEPHQPQFSTQIGRRRRPPTQSPAQRVCVGEEEQWSERALPNRAKRGIRNPRRRRPQWAGRDLDQLLRFCAPEIFCLTQGVTPVMGGPGESRHWRTKFASAASPGDPQGELPRRGKRRWPGPLVSSPSLGKKLAARTAPAGAFRSATAAQRRLLARRCGEISCELKFRLIRRQNRNHRLFPRRYLFYDRSIQDPQFFHYRTH